MSLPAITVVGRGRKWRVECSCGFVGHQSSADFCAQRTAIHVREHVLAWEAEGIRPCCGGFSEHFEWCTPQMRQLYLDYSPEEGPAQPPGGPS